MPWGILCIVWEKAKDLKYLNGSVLRLSRMSSFSFKTKPNVLVLSSLTKPRPRWLSGMFKSTQTLISLFPGAFFLFTMLCSLSALPAELSLQAQESYGWASYFLCPLRCILCSSLPGSVSRKFRPLHLPPCIQQMPEKGWGIYLHCL